MNINAIQISSLEKVRITDKLNYNEIFGATVLGGERFSYQIAISSNVKAVKIKVESPICDCIKLYSIDNVPMDFPVYNDGINTSDYKFITKEPGLMPDLLTPMDLKNNKLRISANFTRSIWLRVDIPTNFKCGTYPIDITIENFENKDIFTKKTMELEVLNISLPKQDLIYTQWFYADCIADAHNVEIYSDKHWELIENYIKTASELGVNMILTPIITPPLDTEKGTARPCVQLAEIKKRGDKYIFNFDNVKKWISICKKHNMEYFEISHLFSQWGSEFSPNIWVDVDGEEKYYFTWGVASDSNEYINFLNQFIPELISLLKEEGIAEKTYFHISDEPTEENSEAYERAYNIVKPLLKDMKTFDALSHYSFYEKGLVETPVTLTSAIDEFLKHNIPNQWAYYCCGGIEGVGNRLLAMPSYRNRILGLQLYKYNIQGFLHWGFNFYNSALSSYKINPYITTSADMAFPSGDPFTVYPGKDGALHSLRGLVFYEGIQDLAVCKLLEKYVGKEKVMKIIEDTAQCEITFSQYPHDSQFLLNLRQKLVSEIKNLISA